MQTGHRPYFFLCAAFVVASLGSAFIGAQEAQSGTPQTNPIKWTPGPVMARLGENAEIQVPKDFLFVDGNGARKFLELTHNPASGSEVGLIVPRSEQESWYVLFEFSDVGYVKDDDKSSIDSAALLASIKKGTEDSNEDRIKRNWKPFHVNSWYTPPFYDSGTQNLTWAINGSEDNGANPAVNYSVRILGRRGTMNVDMVEDPQGMAVTEPKFKTLMGGFRFTDGNRYADFVQGDKLAGYGLTALVAGGATAVAIKTGLFAKFWKLLIFIFAAIGGAIKKSWRKIKAAVTGERDPKEEFPTSTPTP
jgi:uncharacterized membrane-anchored protein